MDQSPETCRLLDRRNFLTSSVGGLGMAALASLLEGDGLLALPPTGDPHVRSRPRRRISLRVPRR